jgi:threonine/homoserine/homoserine lactone efflux protein
MHVAHYGVFVAATLALLLTPGPAVLYIVAGSVEQGRRAGLVSVLGLHAGVLVHLLGALVGLSALLVSSAMAFTLLRWAGAAYLVWLGVRTLRSAGSEPVSVPVAPRLPGDGDTRPALVVALTPRPLRRVFVQGIWVSIFNPKTALFFLAFLPQFVDLARGDARTQMLLLGGTFVVVGLLTDSLYALLAGAAAGSLRRSPRFARGGRYLAGSVYIGLGVATAVAGSRH